MGKTWNYIIGYARYFIHFEIQIENTKKSLDDFLLYFSEYNNKVCLKWKRRFFVLSCTTQGITKCSMDISLLLSKYN